MMSHRPPGYVCPFCLLVQGVENEHVESLQSDIVFRNNEVTALIASRQWPNNRGHVLVIPNTHYENIFDLPDDLGSAIHRVSKVIAVAMKKTLGCDGVSTRQHNEPAGNQDVWHYHLHVFPRYAEDHLYESASCLAKVDERALYAAWLKSTIESSE